MGQNSDHSGEQMWRNIFADGQRSTGDFLVAPDLKPGIFV
jgi:hypothetical protein